MLKKRVYVVIAVDTASSDEDQANRRAGADLEDGVKTYALGSDWFEDGKAPYRVFKVEDDTEVK